MNANKDSQPETLEDALRRLIEQKYGDVKRFAESINTPATSIYSALNRGVSNTRTELTNKIYRALNIDWDTADPDDYHELKLKSDHHNYVEVPLYGTISAGTPIEMIPVEDKFIIPDVMKKKYPNCFLLKVRGNSMNRVIPDDSYALINPTSDVIDGRAYAVCINGFDATIKRVKKLANGFELIPDSTDPTYKTKVYDYGEEGTETVTVIGQVVWFTIPFDFVV